MMFEPGRQVQQREWPRGGRDDEYRDEAPGQSPKQKGQPGGDGLGGLLMFLVLAAVLVVLARDHEVRTLVWTFIRNL